MPLHVSGIIRDNLFGDIKQQVQPFGSPQKHEECLTLSKNVGISIKRVGRKFEKNINDSKY